LPNWAERGVFTKKLNHQPQITRGEAFHLRQVVVQVGGEPRQDSRAPTFNFLSLRQHTADFPIEHEHTGIARHRSAHLGGADALLDVGQQPGVIPNGGGRNRFALWNGFAHATSIRLSSSRM
jgi:hypothetical protein